MLFSHLSKTKKIPFSVECNHLDRVSCFVLMKGDPSNLHFHMPSLPIYFAHSKLKLGPLFRYIYKYASCHMLIEDTSYFAVCSSLEFLIKPKMDRN